MTTVETFKCGDEVLSKLAGGSIMTVLAVEGMMVRCSDEQDKQYWFDTILLERCGLTQSHWAGPCCDLRQRDPVISVTAIQGKRCKKIGRPRRRCITAHRRGPVAGAPCGLGGS